VLLAKLVYVPIQKGNILDLCSGNAVVPLFLSKRTNANIVGIEIQKEIFNMATKSIELNNLQHQIKMIHGDIQYAKEFFGNQRFDVITCNPPYFQTPSEREKNENEFLRLARHEVTVNLRETIQIASQFVRPGGKVAFVHRPERLVDILSWMREFRLEPKKLRLIYPKAGKKANILFVEASKNGKPGLHIEEPLVCYEGDMTTPALRRILYGK
jgi:tRNA1(Val) A37 N6-methylase TrmN6